VSQEPRGRRRLRADARENRSRVLLAASDAFAEQGLSVPLDEIARRAGVGPGTVYRHFPTKKKLFEAVALSTVERLTARAGELAQAPDRGEAFFTFFYEVVAEAATSRAILEALARTGIELKDTAIGQAGDELKQSLANLFIRAQKAGAIRSDLTATDLNALVNGALATQDGGTERSRRLALAVIVDGLRAPPRPRASNP
jgi:AcrR family transcriptional regulator